MKSESSLARYLAEAKRWLLPYQVKWILDANRYRIAFKARQIGWTTVLAFESFISAAFEGRDVLIISAAEKNATEALERVKKWVRLAQRSGIDIKLLTESRTELGFRNNKILSLAQNPDTVRGFTGDVYLDEFAHHPDAEAIYTAAFPITTHGFRLSMVSSPLGQSGRFYDIWTDHSRYPDYSRHKTTIYDAIQQGLKVDPEPIKRNMDEESFRQEYLCEFIDESTAYFPYDLILRCVGDTKRGSGGLFVGIDVGRKRDLTCLATVEQLNGRYILYPLETMKATAFKSQKARITKTWTESNILRGAIDSTGIGMQMAEELRNDLGRIEPVSFTNDVKEQMVVRLKRLMEAGELTIPNDRDLISDIHSIRRTVTSAGNIRFDAERSDSGHADRFWALALAVHAAEKPRASVRIY